MKIIEPLLFLLLTAVTLNQGQPEATCSDLSLPNGAITYSSGSTNNRPFTSRATHSCNTGYTLRGGRTRVCIHGEWTGPDRYCQAAVVCSDLTISNGEIDYNSGLANNRPINTVATYSCNTGYTLSGRSTRTCGNSGGWSGSAATCQLVVCSELPTLANGTIEYSGGSMDSRLMDTVAMYSCSTGYTLSGSSTRTCGSNGGWSGSAPTCIAVTCSDLSLSNGRITYNSGSTNSRPVGTTATHSCNTDYTLSGSGNRTCGLSGLWTGGAPLCEAIMCGSPPAIRNGTKMFTGLIVGETATYSCDPGYTLIGTSTRICGSDGLWSGSPPTCQVVATISCGFPPVIANGFPETSLNTAVGGTVNYICDTGFTLTGTRRVSCLNDGSWSDVPSCQLATATIYRLVVGGVLALATVMFACLAIITLAISCAKHKKVQTPPLAARNATLDPNQNQEPEHETAYEPIMPNTGIVEHYDIIHVQDQPSRGVNNNYSYSECVAYDSIAMN